jgi:hypothetical protein
MIYAQMNHAPEPIPVAAEQAAQRAGISVTGALE